MNRKKQKLELTWIGKDKRPWLEPKAVERTIWTTNPNRFHQKMLER